MKYFISGFAVCSDALARTISDGDTCLCTFEADTSDGEIRAWIAGYGVGMDAGRQRGKIELKQAFRKLMEIT